METPATTSLGVNLDYLLKAIRPSVAATANEPDATRLRAAGHTVLAPTRGELDLAVPDSIDAFLGRQRGAEVDILINNAGINVLRPLAEIDGPTWQSMLQVNLTSALRLTQAFAPRMAARGWGRILNVASIFAVVTRERRAAYSMTKAAPIPMGKLDYRTATPEQIRDYVSSKYQRKLEALANDPEKMEKLQKAFDKDVEDKLRKVEKAARTSE